jgi:hypothetical protein
MLKFLIFNVLIIALVSCQCEENNAEVLVRLDFENIEKPVFSKITADGANRLVPIEKIKDAETDSLYYYIPINSNQDSTWIYFERPARKDTLLVVYKRSFKYKNNNCGYLMEIEMKDPEINTLSNFAYGYSGSGPNFFSSKVFGPRIYFRN